MQKKYFYKSRLHCFSNKNVLTENNEDFLSVNGAQSVRLEKGAIKFKNYFKQIPAAFNIYLFIYLFIYFLFVYFLFSGT